VAKGDWSPPLPHRPATSLAGFRSAFVTSRRPDRLAHSSSWTQASLGRTWRTSPRSLAVSTSWPRGTLACAGTRLEADPDKPPGAWCTSPTVARPSRLCGSTWLSSWWSGDFP